MINRLIGFVFFCAATFGWMQTSHATVGITSLTVSNFSSNSGNSLVTFLARVIVNFPISYSGNAELKVDGQVVDTVTATPGTGNTIDIYFPNISLLQGAHTIAVKFTGTGSLNGQVITGTTSITTTSVTTPEDLKRNAELLQFIIIQNIIEQSRRLMKPAKINWGNSITTTDNTNDRLQQKFVGGEPGVMLAQNEGTLTGTATDASMPMITKSADLGDSKVWFALNNNQYKNNDYNKQGTATNISNGAAAGWTKLLSKKTQGGFFVGYGSDRFELGSISSKTEITSTNVGAFVLYDITEKLESSLSVIYSSNKYDTDVANQKGSTDGTQLGVVGELRGVHQMGSWMLVPSLGVDTTSAFINSYRDSAGTAFDSQSLRTSNVTIAGQVGYHIDGDSCTYTPSAGFSAAQHFSTASVIEDGELAALAGLDVNARRWSGSLNVNYSGLNSNYKTWNFQIGAAVPF